MAAAQGIRAGAAYVELFVRDNRLARGLAAASARLKAFGAGIAGIGARVGAVGAAALSPLVPAVETLTDLGRQGEMALALGLDPQRLTGLVAAFSRFNLEAQDTADVLTDVADWVQDAAVNGGEIAETFRAMGVDAKKLNGLPVDRQFLAIADALSKLDPTLAAGLAARLGGDFQKLLPLLRQGSDAIEELAAGMGTSAADVAAAVEANRAYQQATAQIGRVWREVVVAVAPAVRDLAEWVSRAVKPVVEWVRENREAVRTAALIAAVVLGVGGALVALGATVSLAGFAIGGLVSLFSALGTVIGVVGAVLGAIATPAGLVVAALVALGAVFVTQTETGRRMTEELKAGFTSFADTAKTAWGGIVDAIRAGDLGLAAKIALAGVSLEWAKAVLWWTEKWNAFKGVFVDGWHDAVAGLKLMFWDFTAWIARTFAGAIEKLFQAAAWVADKVGLDDLAKDLRENFDFSDANINRNRDRIKNQILDDRLRRQRDADAARKADAAGAADDVRRAADDLRGLVDEAARRRAAVGERALAKPEARSSSYLDDAIDLSKKVDVQGTFNALALRGLGAETMNARTAKAVDQINDNVKKIALAAAHGALVFA